MRRLLLMLILAAAVGISFVNRPVQAQTGADDYQISWGNITGGGGTSASDDQTYSVTGAIGQPATDLLSNEEFSLIGGILTDESVAASSDSSGSVYLPIIIR